MDSKLCYGNDNPGSGETAFVKSLGYYTPDDYGSPAEYCRNYDTFGASSTCKTTVKQRTGGGYDIDTGLDVQCFGLAPSDWDPNYIMASSVATSRCESAGQPTAEQLETITAADLITYDQARSKDCSAAANLNYNYQWKVLPGDWNVNRGTSTYEWPTAAARAARQPREGDTYEEHTNWTYEGTFNISEVCTDISSDETDDSYWDGPHDSPFYKANHSVPIASKVNCSIRQGSMTGPWGVEFLPELMRQKVGETWTRFGACYEPNDGLVDKTHVVASASGLTLSVNRCAPASSRYFRYRDGQWQLYMTLPSNPQE